MTKIKESPMKLTHKILSITGILLAAGTVALVVIPAVLLRDYDWKKTPGSAKKTMPMETIPVSVKDFDAVRLKGRWQAAVIRDTHTGLFVRVPKGSAAKFQVTQQGRTLTIELPAEVGSGEAVIKMPRLTALAAEIDARVNLVGFKQKNCRLSMTGKGVLTGSMNDFTALSVKSEGTTEWQMKGTTVQHLNLDVSGWTRITITLKDAVLKGVARGNSSLRYYGFVKSDRVQKNGFWSINGLSAP